MAADPSLDVDVEPEEEVRHCSARGHCYTSERVQFALTRIGVIGYRQHVPEDVSDEDAPLPPIQELLLRAVGSRPGMTVAEIAEALTLFQTDMRELGEYRRNPGSPEPEILIQARAAIAAAAKPAPGKALITRRPPVQLVALVLMWLVMIGGPVAMERLPNEIQMMLSTEAGTLGLGIAIVQTMKDTRK